MIRVVDIALYSVIVLAAPIGAIGAGIEGDWTEVTAWVLVIAWATMALLAERRADRYGSAYVLAAGRHASSYARGYSDGREGRTFDASRRPGADR